MSRGQKLLLITGLALSVALVAHTFFASDGWRRRQRAKADLGALQAGIADDEARAAALRAEIDALRSRPAVQEHAVRDELGYVRDHDVIIDLTPPAEPKR